MVRMHPDVANHQRPGQGQEGAGRALEVRRGRDWQSQRAHQRCQDLQALHKVLCVKRFRRLRNMQELVPHELCSTTTAEEAFTRIRVGVWSLQPRIGTQDGSA